MGHPKTSRRIRGTYPEISDAARQLRRRMTDAEEALWKLLRRNKLDGMRFRRQHAVGRFILDFYCPDRKIAVEVDGSIHEDQRDYDQSRDEVLSQYGIRVIRFQNDEVLKDSDSVLERILRFSKDR